MRFVAVKLKYVIFAAVAVLSVIVLCLTSGRTVMTFLVGGRELPIYRVERNDNKIALTFDCAWNDDDIDEIIAVLKKYDVGATFFVTGKWAEEYSDSLNKLCRSGFEIGIHSYNHDDYTKMNTDEILADMEKCDKAVIRATGEKPKLVRVPSGAYNNTAVRTIENSGRKCIQWSVDGLDYAETSREEIYNRAVAKTVPGDIILLHNGTKLTATVLPDIIRGLKGKYEPVSVSELIYDKDYIIDHTGTQKEKIMY